MTTCVVRYRCVVCEVSNCLSIDLMQLERTRPISAQLHEAVWGFHRSFDGVKCTAAELICVDTDSALRDVRFVFLLDYGPYLNGPRNRERAIAEATAEMDWERDGQYLLDRIEASAR